MMRWTRGLIPLALGLVLCAAPAPARAQDPPAEEGKSEGRPVDGYIAYAMIMCLALFIIGKSARR